MSIPLDYEILRLIWWLFLGVLLIGFAIMDGFDHGVAFLLPFVARTETERRVAINSIGPFWDGNQVWLLLGGGALFAAFPPIYAAAFSGFYIAMFLVLISLILRPVGFEFRNKIADPRWRALDQQDRTTPRQEAYFRTKLLRSAPRAARRCWEYSSS